MVIEEGEVLRYTSATDDDPHIAIWLEPPLQVNTGPGPFPPPTASGPFPSLTNFGTLDFVTSNQTTSFLIVFRPMPASSEGTVVHNAGSMRIEARDGGAVGISGTTYHSFRFENLGEFIVRAAGDARGFRSLNGDIVNHGLIDVQGDLTIGIDTAMESTIHNTGDILVSGSHTSVAVALNYGNSTVYNSGLIRAEKLGRAADATAISIAPITGLTSIVNDGEITGDYAVRSGAISDRAVLEILNRGQMNGTVVLEGASTDTLINEGVINGLVYLGGGEDLYDGRLGEVSGPVHGGAGEDILLGGAGSETFYGGDGNDRLDGGGGVNFLYGGNGNDTLVSGADDDLLHGGSHLDIASYENSLSGVTVDLRLSVAQDTGGGGRDTLVSIEGLRGSEFDDVLRGKAYFAENAAVLFKPEALRNNSFSAAVDVSNLFGIVENPDIENSTTTPHVSISAETSGNPEYFRFVVTEAGAVGVFDIDRVFGGVNLNLTIYDAEGNLVRYNDDWPLDPGSLAPLDPFIEHTFAQPGVYYVVVNTNYPLGLIVGTKYTLQISLSDAPIVSDELRGSRLEGGGGNDTLIGDIGNDVLDGGTGNDILIGGLGDDIMMGGAGDDTYYVDSIHDVVIERGGEGRDQVYSTVSFNLNGQSIEDATLLGDRNINLIGNAGHNVLTGNSGNNIIDGGGGIDTMAGGAGDDIYYVDHVRDVVIERGGEGYDLVYSTVSFDLNGQSIEAATLLGSRNANLIGNAGHNVLIGNSGNNIIDGGAGIDTMAGGAGDDIYYVDHVRDQVIERGGEGHDHVYSTVTFNMNGQSLEDGTLLGDRNINLTGNAGHNVLTGNSGNNIIIGGGGVDTIDGGAGNDVLIGGARRDYLTGGAGSDRFVYTDVSDSSYADYDRIMDLSDEDIIDLSGIDADTNTEGDQAFSLVESFTGQAGQITLTYNAGAGFTVLAADVNGDGLADMRIVLYGNHEDFSNFWL
ncbi:M10 family metallopeptidase C-terminal domain-containing protein [Brevundimonas sp.]|uniref:calcium-binding protein n=1 Tax=Brevundimonas sp. TaxID=1871086 RepID=UPI0025BA7FD6|nr:M10 family metallopeptidase C-terminal domain-containing protein [Brevundimonas sp.]